MNVTGNSMVVANIAVFNHFIDPLIGTMEDFWLYRYHSEIYPYTVLEFTKDVDLMNELRIKPSFLEIFSEIDVFENES